MPKPSVAVLEHAREPLALGPLLIGRRAGGRLRVETSPTAKSLLPARLDNPGALLWLAGDLLARSREDDLFIVTAEHIGNLLFFVLLLALIVTLYDRYQPFHGVRFGRGYEPQRAA